MKGKVINIESDITSWLRIMIGCKDTSCVKDTLNALLNRYGIGKNITEIVLENIDGLATYKDNKVIINVLKYDEIANEASGQSEIVSAFLLLSSLYSLVGTKRMEEIIRNEYGKESPIYKLYEILFK
ncbi:hypothetical protein SULI_02035 [Saccharolobus solfataricus]|uniref:Uncharacterized protein n=4 Tax=Saccharolobus solfataricus TaxID=2287 RepID=Q97VM7_SACS2|nr:hypothetical protein [Saccharolobus solfataricus]AAK42717.1 Hypothetical protein SSO2594 [Saccharolobus solfataricus P2]AKA74999.2 hypothetical protein SULB_0400 [Saccharolobus solfataricus]AKA77692.2 hypothetical protein SULC_0398 [Saccharolobus solfataricus]AKA80382.2 hypothetical protein SULA_0398 [Saccharolobus solfataricus]AZF67322.1 hypothetical protein SULG_02035 [Saccharolobus solfataricus]